MHLKLHLTQVLSAVMRFINHTAISVIKIYSTSATPSPLCVTSVAPVLIEGIVTA